MKNTKVLVTGGAGFIGSNLVKHLIENNNSVTVLDNFMSGYLSNLKPFPSVQLIIGDIRDGPCVEKAMEGVEVVFHLAASVGNKHSIIDPILDAETNVLGTIQVLEAARKERVRKIVFSSSAGIFGEIKQLPIKEDHPTEPESPYGCTKLCEEKLCLSYGKIYKIDVVCLRYFNVYGPNQRSHVYSNVIPIFVSNMLQHKYIDIYGDGEQIRDFVHVDDVVQANIKAADYEGIIRTFNIASGKGITINHLAQTILKKNKHYIRYVPKRPGDVQDSVADISLARILLGYSPTVELEIGLENYVEWCKKSLS